MSTFWQKSNKYFCDVCDYWLNNNARNILVHENSVSHKINLKNRIDSMIKNEKDFAEKKKKESNFLKELNCLDTLARNSFKLNSNRAKFNCQVRKDRKHSINNLLYSEDKKISQKKNIQNFISNKINELKKSVESTILESLTINENEIENLDNNSNEEDEWFKSYAEAYKKYKYDLSNFLNPKLWLMRIDKVSELSYYQNIRLKICFWNEKEEKIEDILKKIKLENDIDKQNDNNCQIINNSEIYTAPLMSEWEIVNQNSEEFESESKNNAFENINNASQTEIMKSIPRTIKFKKKKK